MKRLAKKVGRAGKVACQFRFTSTFEYIDLTCVDGWKPEKLHVVWLRGHRRADSPDVTWVPKSETGSVVDGRATFDPPISSALIVTLYQTKEGHDFDQKDYKFYIENEGVNGKKILASFNCNMADFAGIPSEKHALDMTFKPVSKKITKAVLGLTLESEFMKKGKASDDDMMSTFSRVSGNQDDMIGDEDDDDPTASTLVDTSAASNVTKPPDESLASATNGITDEPAHDETHEGSPPAGATAEVSKYVTAPDLQGPCWLPDDISLITNDEQPVTKSVLDQADIIALYFSAEWCPPCKKFLPKLTKFYNYIKEEGRLFQLVYVSSDNTKEGMLGYMRDQQMPWVGLNFESPLGEKLRTDFKVAAIPLLIILSRNGEVISDNAKKPVESASSSPDEMTRLYNKWMRKLLEIKGLPVPDEELVEKKGGIFSSLFSGGKKKDKQDKKKQAVQDEDHADEAPPKQKDKMNEELVRQKEQLERERTMERQVVEEKTKKLHVTLEMNAQMQRELEEKDEKIRILEAKNETLKQTAEAKTEEVEQLKQELGMLKSELSSKAAEEEKLQNEKRELLANISLHGWLCKKGAKGPTANTWRRRYFRIEEGSKLTYYKTAGEGPPQGFIDIDKVTSVTTPPGSQQDKNQCTFHLVTDSRTYELQAHDEATMKKWISSMEYLKEWRAKQKREAQQ